MGVLNWRWAFLINVPVAAGILVATPFLVRPSRAPAHVKLDIPGAVTVTAGLLAFAFGVINRNLYALVSGLALLVLFWLIERRAKALLAAASILSRPTVKWGNAGGLVALSMESGLIFLMTLYLQDVLHLPPLTTGLIFGVSGLASVAAGIIAGRLIGRRGSRTVLTAGLLTQAACTAPLMLARRRQGLAGGAAPALFCEFFGHVTLDRVLHGHCDLGPARLRPGPGHRPGHADSAGRRAIIGAPILSAVAASRAILLSGIHLAVAVDVLVTVIIVAIISTGLRPRPKPLTSHAAERDSDKALAGGLTTIRRES